MPYLVDTNVILNAFNLYPESVFPSLWNDFTNCLQNGTLLVHTRVKDEVLVGGDEKAQWMQGLLPSINLIQTDQAEITSYAGVTNWVRNQRTPKYEVEAARQFLRTTNADPWLIAGAHSRGIGIVTNEKPNPNKTTVVKMPDVAAAFSVPCVTFLSFLESRGVAF